MNSQILPILVDYIQIAKLNNHAGQSAYLEQLIDGLVYELYFPVEIKAVGKEILPCLGELQPITNDMSEEQKLAVIQQEYDRLYDPNHPVCKNIEALDKVEVVRTIRNALER